MIPEYHFPQGFSSTYHRALWGPSTAARLEYVPRQIEETVDPPGVFYPNSITDPQPSRSRRGVALPQERGSDRTYPSPKPSTAQAPRSRL
jgi:hypothetical protein